MGFSKTYKILFLLKAIVMVMITVFLENVGTVILRLYAEHRPQPSFFGYRALEMLIFKN